MTMTCSPVLIILTDPDRAELQSLARARKAPLRSVQRACIILAAADGQSNAQIARDLGLHVDTVRTWRGRFAAHGMKGLGDRPRSGRPPLFAATVVIGIANGFVEAGINPLIATLYRQDKTARLVKLHAWFPGGIVVGGVLAFAFTQFGLGWQAKMLLMLVPSAVYAAMFFAQRFPDSERKAAGVSTAAMYGELKRPLFLVVFACMWLTAATELGPGQWVSNIFNEVMHSALQAGVLLLVWINGIMYALRQFGGGLAHRLSPVTLIAVTAPIAALWLWLFGRADTPVLAFAAAALLAVGTAFWWPTMLGLTSERFPRGGALALAVVGAAGAFSTAVAGPVMGWINNTYGAANVLPLWAVLPVAIALIFGIVHWVDRARGGYRIERVDA